MAKHKHQTILGSVFRDIANIADVLKDSKAISKSLKRTNFDEIKEVDKIIVQTKKIIVRLSGDVTRISQYFNENYKNWQCNIDNVVNGEVVNEALVSDSRDKILHTSQSDNAKETNDTRVPDGTTIVNGNGTLLEGETEDNASDNCNLSNGTGVLNEENGCITKQPENDKLPIVDAVNDVDNNSTSENQEDTEEIGSGVVLPLIETDNADVLEETSNAKSCKNTAEGSRQDDKTKDDNVEIKKESKVILKLIDITKLKSLPATGSSEDSVLVISDSEPEDKRSKNIKTRSQNNSVGDKLFIFVSTLSKKSKAVDSTPLKIGAELTISKINVPGKDVEEVGGSNSKKINGTKSEDLIPNNKRKPKDLLKSVELDNVHSLSSDSGDSYKSKKKVKRLVKKIPQPTNSEKRMINAQNDTKMGYKAYVPMPRYPCEKLKELYLKKIENDDVRRLSDLSNLNKRKRDKHKESDTSSSDKAKNVTKRKRHVSVSSRSSNNSEANDSDDVSILKGTEMNKEPEVAILKEVNLLSDGTASEDEKKTRSKSKKESESLDDGKTKKKSKKDSNNSDDKRKHRWRNDKLLRKNVISDSDSEDDVTKFKMQMRKTKNEVKSRLAKSRAKVVIDSSDSGSKSDSDKRKKSKKSDSSVKCSSSSSSSDSDSSDHSTEKDAAKTKKRGRIKRVKSSSSDEDKTTRKSIRKVIGQESLEETTKQAEKDELERKGRILERQKKYNAIFDPDELADATVEKVVLDFNEETKKELLSVNTDLVKVLKPHQAKGIQFLWDACFESLERLKTTDGSGCILAHCMGLGKTLQVIALVHTLMNNYKKTGVERAMVVCPVNTVLNWIDEFKKWLDDLDGPEIELYELVSNKQNTYRQYLINQWTKNGGVLIIGYDMFRNLTNTANKRIRKPMRDTFYAGMVDPGPDLIICDEGHLLKNEKTHISVAISRVRTARRIVLTGTPIQNNLKEYYCMVQFVKPNLLGTYKEYLNRFVNPITNGQYTDSTPHDISIMRKRAHVLHKMLDGIVQRKDYNVLAPFLPPKYEYVVFIKLSEVQIKLYRHYMDNFARRPVESKLRKTAFLFSDFQEFQRICTHPRLLLVKSLEDKQKAMFIESDEDEEGSLKDFIDDEKSTNSSSSSSSSDAISCDDSEDDKNISSKHTTRKSTKDKPTQRLTRTAAAAASIDVTEILDCDRNNEANEWWRQIVDGDELENIALGGKLYLLFEILQQCEIIGDKILIFSQSLYSLNIIEYFLGKIDEATQEGKTEKVCGFSGSWASGLDYFRIDGSSSCDNRAAWCKHFNNPDNNRARLFLISTKAGGLGINLVGANRVIIFDVSWNPSHDTQSIYRIYRFGQSKPCYIYRFVTWGSMEMKIYERQVTKQAISKRVIDEQQIDRHYNQNDLAELYNFEPYPAEPPTPLLPKDVLLAELLQKEKERIYKYHEHQSLLENKEEEELDEAERKAAWEEYENEKTNPPVLANSGIPGGWISNLPMVSINAALLNILQRDNPTWTREQVQAVIPIVAQQLREQVEKGETLLYNRIVQELKQIQLQQQQKLQQYYIQQQLQMLQQQQPTIVGNVKNFQSVLNRVLNAPQKNNNGAASSATKPIHSNEIVELND